MSKQAADWRGEMLARIRKLIQQADPDIVEEVKWRKASNPAGVPVWSHAGMICTGETYKDVVKITFAKGAALPDPSGLFNSSLEGNMRRAIDFHEGDDIDEKTLKALDSRGREAESRRVIEAASMRPTSLIWHSAAAELGASPTRVAARCELQRDAGKVDPRSRDSL